MEHVLRGNACLCAGAAEAGENWQLEVPRLAKGNAKRLLGVLGES